MGFSAREIDMLSQWELENMIAGYQASQGATVETSLSDDEFDELARWIEP